jgi:hypothetical protein
MSFDPEFEAARQPWEAGASRPLLRPIHALRRLRCGQQRAGRPRSQGWRPSFWRAALRPLVCVADFERKGIGWCQQSQGDQRVERRFGSSRLALAPSRHHAVGPQGFAIVGDRAHSAVALGGESGKMGVPFRIAKISSATHSGVVHETSD